MLGAHHYSGSWEKYNGQVNPRKQPQFSQSPKKFYVLQFKANGLRNKSSETPFTAIQHEGSS